jgi:hypothetical protein
VSLLWNFKKSKIMKQKWKGMYQTPILKMIIIKNYCASGTEGLLVKIFLN